MIGKNIRHLRHLFNNVGDNEKKDILCYIQRENRAQNAFIYKFVDENQLEWWVIFNNSDSYHGCFDAIAKISEAQQKEIIDLKSKWRYFIAINRTMMSNYSDMYMLRTVIGDEIILLPDNFEKDYKAFCDNNKKIIKELARICDVHGAFCKYVYSLCNASPNMMQWAIKNTYQKYVHFSFIKNILYYFTNYSNLNGKCKKGTIVAYNGNNDIIKLHNELSNLRREKRIKNVINSFNTAQKKILREVTFNEREESIINRFATLSLTKQRNFIRKMSTIEDVNEIFKQMSLVSKFHFNWDKTSFMEFISNADNEFKFDIIFDKDNVIVLKVKDYETIKHVAKTTNWCISKNKTYWYNYMKQRHHQPNFQYVLLDFNKEEDDETSIVGFTTQNDKKITHAHSFTNQNLMRGKNVCNYKYTFNLLSSSIYNVLESCNVPLDLFTKVSKLPYKWDLDTVLKMLKNNSNHQILKNENNKLTILFNDTSFLKFIDSENYYRFINNIGENPSCNPHVLFFDFNLTQDNINKLLFCYITKIHEQDYITPLYNINGNIANTTFDTLCDENNISTDFLCRRNLWCDKLIRALETKNVNAFKSLLLDENAKNEIELHFDTIKFQIARTLRESINDDCAFDILMTIYECGYTLTQLTDLNNILGLIIDQLRFFRFVNLKWKNVPCENDFNKLIQGKFNNNPNKATLFGRYFVLEMIMQHETDITIVQEFAKSLRDIVCECFVKHILEYVLNFHNKITSISLLKNIINIIIGNNYNELLERILINQPSKNMVSVLLSNIAPQHEFFERIKAMSENKEFVFC